ncbi:MAG: universal stress protein [Pseudomonadota bacterium]
MSMFKKIVAAIDFSDYSAATLRYAASLAQDQGASLVLVNVINQRDVDAIKSAQAYADILPVDEFLARTRKERLEGLEKMLQEAHCQAVPHEKVLRIGIPYEEILAAVKESGADLVVMGTKGRTNLASTLFGSTAEKVFRRALVPVLSVRGQEHADLLCKLPA